ncbi:MAG: rubrerythrin family protein [Thermoanaerobaculia bacterium]
MTRPTRPLIWFFALLTLGGICFILAESPVVVLLQDAITGEREAQARYVAFAKKADEEGYAGVASLFRAAAAAEKVHEERFLKLLAKRDGRASAEVAPPEVGTTKENIQTAMQAEQTERDKSYHDAIEAARDAGDPEVAALFDLARTAEAEHANLLMAANWQLESMKAKKSYWVCNACGFTSEAKLARCPLCPKGARGKLNHVD